MEEKKKQKKDHTKSGLAKIGSALVSVAGIAIMVMTGKKNK